MSKAGFIYLIIGVIAIILIVYGSFLLLSPGYRENVKTRPMKYKKQPPQHLAKIGSFWLEPGEGMSLEESGQKFSSFASGQNPNLKGHNNQNIEEQPDIEGDQKFFNMFLP